MEASFTFEELFEAFKSNYSNHLMTPEQNENLMRWHERRGKEGITLSQSDFWMTQAGLIKKKVLSITHTGESFSKFRKFSLNEKQFHEYLEALADYRSLDLEDVKARLLLAGLPKPKLIEVEPEVEPEMEQEISDEEMPSETASEVPESENQ